MRVFRIFALCALAATASIALAEDIRTDYDRSADFSRYKTFMWIKEPAPAEPMMKPRIIDAINAQLRSKGLKLVTAHADIGVSVNASTKEEHSLEKVHGGYPGWGQIKPWGNPTATVEINRTGLLVIDLFDTRTRKVTWWGAVSDEVSMKPEKKTKRLNKAIKQMFENFPPRPADQKGNDAESEKPRTRPVRIIEEYWEFATIRCPAFAAKGGMTNARQC